MDDGLYSVSLEPISENDPRFYSLPVFDVTSPGDFVPMSHIFSAMTGLDEGIVPLWTTEVLSPSSSMGRVLAQKRRWTSITSCAHSVILFSRQSRFPQLGNSTMLITQRT